MKAISLWQPWASLVVKGKKKIETRSWSTDYRGVLVIHAAKKPWTQVRRLILTGVARMFELSLGFDISNWKKKLPMGAVLGKVTLVDCVLITKEFAGDLRKNNPEEFWAGDYTPGRYAWILKDPVEFSAPIEYTGRQRIFNFGTRGE